ncbi:M48 family peptidase, partial [candidate division KSB1 bacterium]|nr:M48 family peptidase [candidate division KSB1 bacterium]
MNIYALIIVTTLLIDYLVSHWADWLNIKHLSKTLPDEFKEWYDQEEYARSQEYTRVNTKFEFITST